MRNFFTGIVFLFFAGAMFAQNPQAGGETGAAAPGNR